MKYSHFLWLQPSFRSSLIHLTFEVLLIKLLISLYVIPTVYIDLLKCDKYLYSDINVILESEIIN